MENRRWLKLWKRWSLWLCSRIDRSVDRRWFDEVLWVDWIHSILTQALVNESPRRNILNFEFISIKMTRTIIVKTEFVYWKKIHSYPRHMKDIFEDEVMIFSRQSSITYMIDRERPTIAHSDLFGPFVLRLKRKVVEVCSKMIRSTWICKPRIFFVCDGCIRSTSHCNKLGRMILALKCKIHPMITIQSLMAQFPIDLARWTIKFVILRRSWALILKILWRKILKRISMVGILLTTIVIKPTSSSTSIEIISTPSSSRTMILRLILRGATSLAIWGKHCKRVKDWI